MKVQKLCNDIYLFTDDQSFYENVTLIWTELGPVIIDAFRLPEQFAIVQDHIETKGFDKPLLQIFTHWHADHTLGNQNLQDVKIIAHHNTKDYLLNVLNRELKNRLIPNGILPEGTLVFPPTETFQNNFNITIGNVNFQLVSIEGHTSDSIVVFLPEKEILIAGDNLVGPEVEFYFPPVIPPDESNGIDCLLKVYRMIRSFKPKIIIPGHGWILPPEEMLGFNEHRYKVVIKRTIEVFKRGLQNFENIENYSEHLIGTWLSQANTCATVGEQEALKENVSKVLKVFSKSFDQVILNTNMNSNKK